MKNRQATLSEYSARYKAEHGTQIPVHEELVAAEYFEPFCNVCLRPLTEVGKDKWKCLEPTHQLASRRLGKF